MSSSVSSSHHPPDARGGGASHQKKMPSPQQQQQQQQATLPAAASTSASSVQSAPRSRRQQRQQQQRKMKSSWSFSPQKNENSANMSGCQSVASVASAPVNLQSSSPLSSSSPVQQQQQPPPSQPPSQPSPSSSSLPDQLTDLAWQGSLEILKLASGISGQVVAPPLFHVVLPRLWNTTRECLSKTTPRRGKDWFAILSSSITQLIFILGQTAKGHEFVERLKIWWYSVVTCLTSSLTRQVVMDATAWNVFFMKLLATPECHAVMRQGVTTICRGIDVLYSHKQVWYDFMALASSWIALLNDASTTAALAEVTARFCLALEMEQAALHRQQTTRSTSRGEEGRRRRVGQDPARSESGSTSQQQQQKQKRRRERNANQTAVYQTPILMTRPDATVEDVILSSLGLDAGTTMAKTRTTTNKSSGKDRISSRGGANQQSNKYDDQSVKDNDDDDADNNMSLSSSTTASPLPPSDKENDDDEDDDGEGNNINDGNTEQQEDLQAKPVNVDYLRQRIITNQQRQQSGGTDASAIASSSATTTRSSSTTTKTNHTTKKKPATAVHENDNDHSGDEDDDYEDMEDLILVETVLKQDHDENDENNDDFKKTSALGKRNRALVQASGSKNGSPLREDNKLEEEEDDDDSDDHAEHQQSTAITTPLPLPVQEQPPRQPPQQLDGESSVSYFYRVLDQVLDDERKNGIQHLWASNADGTMPRGRVRRRPLSSRQTKNTATLDENNTNDDDWPTSTASTAMTSVWEQFKQVMAEAAAAQQQYTSNRDSQPLQTAGTSRHATTKRRSRIMIFGLLAVAAVCLMTFSAFGCYGVYTFFFGQSLSPLTMTTFFSRNRHHQQQQDEVVIRIIRQVVHVDAATGHVLTTLDDRKASSVSLLQEPQVMNKISECVANVMDEL